jgi:hypothetical protein
MLAIHGALAHNGREICTDVVPLTVIRSIEDG